MCHCKQQQNSQINCKTHWRRRGMSMEQSKADPEGLCKNQLLLNAIRNKFAGQGGGADSSDAVGTAANSIKLEIPALKPNGLNSFLLSQLHGQQHQQNGVTMQTASFMLPKLHTSGELSSGNGGTFVIPLLKQSQSSAEAALHSLSDGISQLQVSAAVQGEPIDLRSALSTATSAPRLPHSSRSNAMEEDFEIPFIKCDSRALPADDEYCKTDVTQTHFGHTLVRPSPVGRIICLRFGLTAGRKKMLGCTRHSFKVKHMVEQFRFTSKSPDDLVLETLSKYQRFK